MTELNRMIKAVSAVYGDGEIEAYFLDDNGEHGDTLAQFIARELRYTFEDEPDLSHSGRIELAIKRMERAKLDLDDVIGALDKL